MTIHPNYATNTQLIKCLKALNTRGLDCMLDNPSNGTSLGRFIFHSSNDFNSAVIIMSKFMPKKNIKLDINL